jgi:hypothetical protein
MELHARSQRKFVHQPIRAHRPGLGQAGGHGVAGEGFDQRIMQGIEKHKRGREPGGLGRIEIGGRDGGVEGNHELALGLAVRDRLHTHERRHRSQDHPHEYLS